MSLRPNLNKPWVWGLVWLAGTGFILANVGFWLHDGAANYQDVNQYASWAGVITQTGSLPTDHSWQYPPAAAVLFLLPRLGGGNYGQEFVAMMLVIDLLGLLMLVGFAKKRGDYTGVWLWLLGFPLLGSLSVLRFDLAPTVLTMAALVVLHRRPRWFGAAAGLGASLKLWPIVVLFGEWDRRRLVQAVLSCAGVIAIVFVGSAIAFGNPFSFVSQQGGRGLQVESVATIPWQLHQIVTGIPVPQELRFGAWEIPGTKADTIATLLDVASLVVLALAAAWWLARDRAIRSGREDLATDTVARDFVFAIVLLLVLVSRVLSPQYMIWLIGVSALTLTDPESRLRRPAWVIVAALFVSMSVYESPINIVVRNLLLLAASFDAVVILIELLRAPRRTNDVGTMQSASQTG